MKLNMREKAKHSNRIEIEQQEEEAEAETFNVPTRFHKIQ